MFIHKEKNCVINIDNLYRTMNNPIFLLNQKETKQIIMKTLKKKAELVVIKV